MDLKLFLTVAATVFLAELGDKTQLATMLFSAREDASRLTVFFAACVALIAASGIGVLAGGLVSQYIEPAMLSRVAGVGFLLIGAWTIWQA